MAISQVQRNDQVASCAARSFPEARARLLGRQGKDFKINFVSYPLVNCFVCVLIVGFLMQSVEGRELWVVRISTDDHDDGRTLLKPMFKYVGNMHGKNYCFIRQLSTVNAIRPANLIVRLYCYVIVGNEALSRQVLLYLTEHLLNNYAVDNFVTRMINSTEIHILPSMNPDGFERATEGNVRCDHLISLQ